MLMPSSDSIVLFIFYLMFALNFGISFFQFILAKMEEVEKFGNIFKNIYRSVFLVGCL